MRYITEKDIDKVLHQIYYLMNAYWYGSEDVKDGTIDLSISYEDWKVEIRHEYMYKTTSITEEYFEYLKILEDYKNRVKEM